MTSPWVFLDDCTLKRPALTTQGVLRGCAEMANASVPPMAERPVLTVLVAAAKSVRRRRLGSRLARRCAMVCAGWARRAVVPSWSLSS
eukprot:12634116-Heterocapsa_arctica.AAC.1